MTEANQIVQDLQFVKEAIHRRERKQQLPLPMALLWGGLMLVGFPLADFPATAPHSGTFWFIAFPIGILLSWWYAAHCVKADGDMDSAEARRDLLHWAGMAVFWALIPVMACSGNLTGAGCGQVSLLLVAFSYYLAWVHFRDYLLLWGAVLLVGAYVAMSLITTCVWTITGATLFVVLVGGTLLRKRCNA